MVSYPLKELTGPRLNFLLSFTIDIDILLLQIEKSLADFKKMFWKIPKNYNNPTTSEPYFQLHHTYVPFSFLTALLDHALQIYIY